MIYFIQAGADGPVKIGTAASPRRRMAELQVGHFNKLSLLRSMPGGVYEEHCLHHHYETSRIRGEWFTYADSMMTVSIDGIDGLHAVPSDDKPQEHESDRRAAEASGTRKRCRWSDDILQWPRLPPFGNPTSDWHLFDWFMDVPEAPTPIFDDKAGETGEPTRPHDYPSPLKRGEPPPFRRRA